MSKKAIKVTCEGADLLSLDRLTPFQGNLKELSTINYEKLKAEILELGFSEPISVWVSDKNYIINGHQRVRVLQRMRDIEGYKIPDLPVSYITADTYKQAKKKVLALTSQYGQLSDEGLLEFITEADIELEELKNLRFPDLNLDIFFQAHSKNLSVETINRGDEFSEWVDLPEFERGEKDIKLTFIFKTEADRKKYVDDREIEITQVYNGQWTCRL